MTSLHVLAWLLALAPRASVAALVPVADAIAQGSPTPAVAALLAVTALHEGTLAGRGVPLGWMGCRRRCDVAAAAHGAARVFRRAARACGPDPARQFAFYVAGRCAVSPEARRRAVTLRRLFRGRSSTRTREVAM